MRLKPLIYFGMGILLLQGCSPVKNLANNEYQLSAFSTKRWASKPRHVTLLVTAPEAVAEYQTDQMLYMKIPYKIEAFAKNEWVSPPADMLYPLLVQSLQSTGYFYAVGSSLYNVDSDYRLDTQLLNLEQNFIKKPSVLDMTVKVVLTRVTDNKIIASKIINQHVVCPLDTPYGGVLAANRASLSLTAHINEFVISHLNNIAIK